MPDKPHTALPLVSREGFHYRVYKPEWADPPNNVSHSKTHGGRWNPSGKFGALYLNPTLAVAAAQARHQHAGRAIKLFDLLPERRPILATFAVPATSVVNVVNAHAIHALQLPEYFPHDVAWEPCQVIAQRAYGEGIAGIATRSHAESTPTSFIGEELALFDSHPLPALIGQGKPFEEWYPDPIPH